MKKTGLLLLTLLAFFVANAQDYEKQEIGTIFNGNTFFNGFGGPIMSYTTIAGKFAHSMGGGGGVLVNNRFFFGGFGTGVTNRIRSEADIYDGYDINFGYGGLWTGYNFLPQKPLHPTVSLLSGWGNIDIEDSYVNDIMNDDLIYVNDQVFVLTPTVEVELNITTFFKIGIGANYRLVFGVDDLIGYDNSDFSGPSGFLSFKFGGFRRSR